MWNDRQAGMDTKQHQTVPSIPNGIKHTQKQQQQQQQLE